MGWPQPPALFFVNNMTAVGIANRSIKQQRSRDMNVQYFWVIDQVDQNTFKIKWAPGLGNLADYFTKHFQPVHHCKVRPFYLHQKNKPRCLLKAPTPWDLRGCIKPMHSSIPVWRGNSPLPTHTTLHKAAAAE